MRVLAVGAHPDDLEIGCGGALARHAQFGDEVLAVVMTTGTVKSCGELRVAESLAAAKIMGTKLIFGNATDGEVTELEVNKFLEQIVQEFEPDVIYTHGSQDSHSDHRAVAAGTLAAGRYTSTILQFESPSALNFQPDIYVDISGIVDIKIDALECHASQLGGRSRVNSESARAKARAYGYDARLEYAEAFVSPRTVWDPHHDTAQLAAPAQRTRLHSQQVRQLVAVN